MGRFIITRGEEGVRFLLESTGGMALAASRPYKTLDACKKGIASLVAELKGAPLVDATAGESAPNPKIEVVEEDGGYALFVKARNGKSVIATQAYATKKAARRAASMLRKAALGATLYFAREAGLTPLTMMKTPQRGVAPNEEASPRLAAGAETPERAPYLPLDVSVPDEAPTAPDEAPTVPDEAPTVPNEAPIPEAVEIAAEAEVAVPAPLRLVRVGETRGTAPRPTPSGTPKKAQDAPHRERSPLLARILRRK